MMNLTQLNEAIQEAEARMSQLESVPSRKRDRSAILRLSIRLQTLCEVRGDEEA